MIPQLRAQELIYEYTALADRKDIPATGEFFADAVIHFPSATAQGKSEVEAMYAKLWAGPEHRHAVTNVRIVGQDGDRYQAKALYTKWEFRPDPVMTTLGEYEFTFSADRILALKVTRTWQEA